METVKVRCISAGRSIYLKKGEVYEAYRAKNDFKGRAWCIRIEQIDDPGDYAFSSSLFEVVPEGEEVHITRL